MTGPELDPDVRAYYERRGEENRLEEGAGQLEAVRTRALIERSDRWADPRRRADILRVAEALEGERYLLGASPHLLAVARRP